MIKILSNLNKKGKLVLSIICPFFFIFIGISFIAFQIGYNKGKEVGLKTVDQRSQVGNFLPLLSENFSLFGEITKIEKDCFLVKTSFEKEMKILFDQETEFVRVDSFLPPPPREKSFQEKIKFEDLRIGNKVRIVFKKEIEKDKIRAKKIEVKF